MTPEEPQAASVLKVKPAAAVEAAVAVEDALEAARAVEESEAEEAAALKHQKTSSPVHSSLAMSTPEHPSAPSAAQDVGSPRRLGEGLQLEEDLAAEDEWLSFQEMRLPTDSRDRQNKLQDMAESKANELLRWIRKNYADKAWVGGGSQPGAWREGGQWIGPSILTIESLTAGDMFRIIGNIPFHGAYKYGSLVVYNTNAKRTFAGVVNEDLYSHSCAKQMALQGLRDNSNATVSIAVTGNAMTKEKDWPKQGEVYCCCAAYSCADAAGGSKIFYRTSVFNVCKESRPPVPKALRELQSTCKDWTKGYATGREEKAGRVRGELEEALKRFCGSDCDTSKYQEIINKPREDGGLHELNESDRTRAMELVKSQEFLDLADSKVQIEKLVDVIAEKGDSPIHDRAGRMGHNAEVSQGIRTWTAAKAFEECLQLLMDIEAIPGRKYSIKAPLEVKEQLQLFGDHVPSAHAPPRPSIPIEKRHLKWSVCRGAIATSTTSPRSIIPKPRMNMNSAESIKEDGKEVILSCRSWRSPCRTRIWCARPWRKRGRRRSIRRRRSRGKREKGEEKRKDQEIKSRRDIKKILQEEELKEEDKLFMNDNKE